jgi:hypothetical protein
VVEGGDGTGLLLEAGERLGVAGPLLGQHLDRDVTAQPRVPSAVELSHAPGPDEVQDLVPPQPRARGQGHAEPRGKPVEMMRCGPVVSMSRSAYGGPLGRGAPFFVRRSPRCVLPRTRPERPRTAR